MIVRSATVKNKEKILVTGATGFIGSHLVDKLVENGRTNIRALVLKKPIEEIENENLDRLKKLGVEIVYGDIRNFEDCKKATKEIDVIFHLAAISRPMQVSKKIYYDTNELGVKNMIAAVKDRKIKKFVHISTVSVLGLSPDGHPLSEEEFQPEDQEYGLSKRAGEKVALKYQTKYNLPLTVIRPCLIYGPRCLVRAIMFKYTQKRLFPLFNNGRAKMEFCYVDNLIDAIFLAEKNPKAIGEAFNITDGKSYNIKEIIDTIAQEEGVGKPIIRMPYFLGKFAGYVAEITFPIFGKYPPFSSTAADWMSKDVNVYNVAKAKKILGYRPKISLKEGVKKTIKWYKDKGIL